MIDIDSSFLYGFYLICSSGDHRASDADRVPGPARPQRDAEVSGVWSTSSVDPLDQGRRSGVRERPQIPSTTFRMACHSRRTVSYRLIVYLYHECKLVSK